MDVLFGVTSLLDMSVNAKKQILMKRLGRVSETIFYLLFKRRSFYRACDDVHH